MILTSDQQRVFDELRAFAGGAAARIHAASSALVTLGGGQVRFAKQWDDDAYGLDFVQILTRRGAGSTGDRAQSP